MRELEPLYLESDYFRLFESLIILVESNQGIHINEVVKILSNEGFDVDNLKESINYFLLHGYFYKLDKNEKFENIRLGIKKKPDIRLFKNKEISEYPKLVMSLPPYDTFGLKRNLELANINYFNIKNEFEKLFECSEESIYICSPFLEWNGFDAFLPILLSKAKKGVDIKIISRQIDKNDFQSRFQDIKKVNDHFINNFSKVQIRNYHYHSNNYVISSTHAKFIVCDNNIAYIGSGELRNNSFEKNFELGVIIQGKKAKQLGIIFNRLFSVSEEIDFNRG